MVNDLPTASISGSTSICTGQPTPIVFNGTPNSIVSYTFNNGATQTITLNSAGVANIISPALLNNGTYTLLSVELNSNPSCSQLQNGTANIMVVSYPTSPSVSSDVIYCLGESIEQMTATANSGGSLIWYSNSNLTDSIGFGSSYTPLSESATYYVTELSSFPYCESSPSVISITFNNCEIKLPTAFTPDGDKVNDTWILDNIDEIYPKNNVRVYNRWGILVYESLDGKYEQSPWDGKFNDEDLPVASYYYVIEFNDEKHNSKKGIVTIIRL
jgi:gliding motility-associated-like protein